MTKSLQQRTSEITSLVGLLSDTTFDSSFVLFEKRRQYWLCCVMSVLISQDYVQPNRVVQKGQIKRNSVCNVNITVSD